jgi:hypothetical protein
MLMLSVSLATAAPPRVSISLEEQMASGCRHAAQVFIGQVTDLKKNPREGGDLQTGKIVVREMLKGKSEDVPATVTRAARVPMQTDQMGSDLEDGMIYLAFMNAPAAPGLEAFIPERAYDPYAKIANDKEFRAAVALARQACASAKP